MGSYWTDRCALAVAAVLLCAVAAVAVAQAPLGPPDWIRIPAYPARETDPAAVERGKNLYTANGCSFCHGQDARGGNGGPSLLRAQSVLRDQKGETIAGPILKGVPNTTMVAFRMQDSDVADIAEFLHSFPATGADRGRNRPKEFVTGNATAGKRYFAKQCASCHAAEGDLRGLASKFSEPRPLQQYWLMPAAKALVTAVVTLPDGVKHEGTLVRQDEFLITLQTADGRQRTFDRDGAIPTVEVRDRLAAHKSLLPLYTDRDIHNLTAYLVTLK